MTKYDPKVISEFATRLYHRAGLLVFIHVVGFGLLGAVAGRLMQSGNASIAVGFLIGAGIGYYLGENKAFLFRLQAQMALCQAEIERNTRTSTSSPPTENVSSPVLRPSPAARENAERIAHAIFSNNIEVISALIAGGADVNAPNENGITPLRMAKNCERREITELLTKAGARE